MSKSRLFRLLEENVIWLGIFASGAFWVLDSSIHVFIFGNGILPDQIISPASHEIWTRVLVSFILIMSSALVQSYILKRKKADKIAAETIEKFQTLFELANDSIFLMEKDTFVDCNKKTLELFGCTRDQIIGQPPYSFSPEYQPDGQLSRKSAKEKINAALRGKRLCFEWQHCKYDGTLFDAEVSLKSLNLSGRIYIQAIVRDATERKRSERIIRESERKYRSLINNANYSILVADREHRITMINDFGVKNLNSSMQNIIGKKVDAIFPNIADELRRRFKIIFDSGEEQTFEDNIALPSGENRWYLSSLQPYRDMGEKITGVLIISYDITDKKNAEVAIKENQTLLNSILESTGDGILVVNSEGKVTHTNSRFAEMWRLPEELIESRDDDSLLEFVLNQISDPKAFLEKVKKLYNSAERDSDIIHFKDGRIFKRYSYALVINEKISGRVWNFRDITKSGKTSDELSDAQRINVS